MTEDFEARGRFHKRLNEARATIYTADWTPDKAFKIQGNIVPYVSINKMKRNIAPALLKHGIDFDVNFKNLEMRQNGSSAFWSVECTVTFYDVDGYSMSATAIGGCGATDKGINICQTYALKQVLSNVFLLIDGIEPEDLEKSTEGTFRKKTEEEVEEVKSEILANKDIVKAPKKEEPKEEPVKETPKEEPKEEPVKEEPKAVNPALKSIDVDSDTALKFELAGPQKNTVAKIVEDWTAAAKEGRTTPENYNQMSYDRASMASTKDAVAFIRKYKVVF